jgi:hypothetical protein
MKDREQFILEEEVLPRPEGEYPIEIKTKRPVFFNLFYKTVKVEQKHIVAATCTEGVPSGWKDSIVTINANKEHRQTINLTEIITPCNK